MAAAPAWIREDGAGAGGRRRSVKESAANFVESTVLTNTRLDMPVDPEESFGSWSARGPVLAESDDDTQQAHHAEICR